VPMSLKACAQTLCALAADPSQTAAAGALLQQYGEDAVVIATLRAAEEAASGRMDLSDHWMAIAAILEDMDPA